MPQHRKCEVSIFHSQITVYNDSRPENDRARQKRDTSPCFSSHLLPTPMHTCLPSSCRCFPTMTAANSRGLLSGSVTTQMARVRQYTDSAFFSLFLALHAEAHIDFCLLLEPLLNIYYRHRHSQGFLASCCSVCRS